jgi:cyclic-di-GMP-binding protein
VQFTLGGMDKHIVGQPLPLPQQKRQIGQVMRDFQKELALGYKLAIVDLCGPRGAVPFLRGRYAVLAVVRAMEHLSALLSKCYVCYSETPANCWSELNALLTYAVSQNLQDKFEKDPQVQGVALSPTSCYVQAALMFLSNPYRLTQREIVDLDLAARVWAQYVQLRFDGKGDAVFCIDPDSDQPPGVRVSESARRMWRLDCQGLVQHIKGALPVVGRDGLLTPRSKLGQGNPVHIDLVERLLLAWGFGGEREHQRMPAGHMLDAVIGLQAAHYLIAGEKDFNVFVTSLSTAGINLSERERAAAWAQASSESAKPQVSSVEVLDQSLGGYRLYWSNAVNLRAKVGELIALAQPVDEDDDDPRDWMVGVLRWLRGADDDRLEAGVQLVTRRAEAVAIRAVTEGRNKVLHRGLLLHGLSPDPAAAKSLLSNHLLEESHRCELLRMPDPDAFESVQSVSPIDALKLSENTGSYKVFGFALDGAAPASGDSKPSAALEAIWSTV